MVALPKEEEEVKASPTAVSASRWKTSGAEMGRKMEEEILPRELRVVAGQELPNVRLEVDLYRFAQAERAESAGGNGEENP